MLWLAVLLSLAFTASLFFRTDLLTQHHPDFIKPWDHHKYIYMAEHPLQFHIAPFCWRILNPLAAAVLPFSLESNFILLAFLAEWGSGIGMFLICRAAGFNNSLSVLGMLAFFSNAWAAKSPVYFFYTTDAMVLFFIIMLLWMIISKKDMLFMTTLCAGALLKESVLFMIPLFYSMNARSFFDKAVLRKSVLYCFPAVIVLIGVRVGIPSKNEDSDYKKTLPAEVRLINYLDPSGTTVTGTDGKIVTIDPEQYEYASLLSSVIRYRLENFSVDQLRELSVRTFGWIVIVSLFWNLQSSMKLMLRVFPFVILSYVQLLFALNTNRLIIIIYPVLIIGALHGIHSAINHSRYFLHVFYGICITGILLNLSTRLPVPNQFGTIWFIVSFFITVFVLYRNFIGGTLSKDHEHSSRWQI